MSGNVFLNWNLIRRKLYLLLFILVGMGVADAQTLSSDTVCIQDTITESQPCSALPELKPHPWRAMGELVLVNGFIHVLDRYILHESYSNTTLKSIRRNFKSGFAWDDDQFYYNSVGHPYQGSLSFNTARSNGMSFLQSVPYTFAGSLAWELFGENEQPSINDMITTVAAGSLLGEITHTLAQDMIDERQRGGKRFLREMAIAVVNPVEGFNRLISGRSWKVRNCPSDEEAVSKNKMDWCGLTVGGRYVASAGEFSRGTYQPFLAFKLQYGSTTDGEVHVKPYDSFSLGATFAYGNNQYLFSDMYMTARICGFPAFMSKRTVGEWGIYHYFTHEYTRTPGQANSPFPFGEMASFGPGIHLSFPNASPYVSFQQRLYTRGVLLGTINSDYYDFDKRNYNMGSGYGATSLSQMTWQHVGTAQLKIHFMHLFTWKGYEPRDLSEIVPGNKYLNVLGDRSHARLLSVNLQTETRLYRGMSLALGASYFSRHSHYRYHPNQRAESYEMRAGLTWLF